MGRECPSMLRHVDQEHLDPCFVNVSVRGRYQSTGNSRFTDHARSPRF